MSRINSLLFVSLLVVAVFLIVSLAAPINFKLIPREFEDVPAVYISANRDDIAFLPLGVLVQSLLGASVEQSFVKLRVPLRARHSVTGSSVTELENNLPETQSVWIKSYQPNSIAGRLERFAPNDSDRMSRQLAADGLVRWTPKPEFDCPECRPPIGKFFFGVIGYPQVPVFFSCKGRMDGTCAGACLVHQTIVGQYEIEYSINICQLRNWEVLSRNIHDSLVEIAEFTVVEE